MTSSNLLCARVPVHVAGTSYNLHSLMRGASCSRHVASVPRKMKLLGILSSESVLQEVNLSFVQVLCIQSLCSENLSKEQFKVNLSPAQGRGRRNRR